jgi:hypothetical protein
LECGGQVALTPRMRRSSRTDVTAWWLGGPNGLATGRSLGWSGGALELVCNQNDQGPGRVQVDALIVVQQVDVVN